MVFIEVISLLVISTILVTVIQVVGKNFLEKYAQTQVKSLSSDNELKLTKRIEALEEELRQTNQRLLELKDTTEFAVKLIEEKKDPQSQKQI